MNPETMRLDAAMVDRGLAGARQRAKERITAGDVLVNGRIVRKAATTVGPEDEIRCVGEDLRYVGRGGLKLEKALAFGNLTLKGACAMDVGASTGGFTDCMLQNGARKVYAIDVGHGQLHPRLTADARVVNLEGTDIRRTDELTRRIAPASVNFCSIDVSFISVKKIFPSVLPFLQPGARIVCLIKPQFEAGRAAVGKKGVVHDPKVHVGVINDLCAFFFSQGCTVNNITYSPVAGGDGNIEYLALMQFDGSEAAARPLETDSVVRQAHRELKK